MFKTLPNGVEIYFSWPSRTARIVPNKSTKYGIMMRDNRLFALVAGMGLVAALLREPSPTLGLVMGLLGVAGFVERSRYLSRLPKLPLEVSSSDSNERSTEPTKSVQITIDEIDNAYIAERWIFDGVLLTAVGVLMTAGSLYLLLKNTEIPLGFSLPLTACALITTYVGCRILVGKMAKQRGKRRRRQKDAI